MLYCQVFVTSTDKRYVMYKSDSFEPVTKPTSWSILGSAGGDAIYVSLSRSVESHALIQIHFSYVKFLENFYLY